MSVRHIEDYSEKLAENVRIAAHPNIQLAGARVGLVAHLRPARGLARGWQASQLREAEPGAFAMTSPALSMHNTSNDRRCTRRRELACEPDALRRRETPLPYTRDMAFELPPHSNAAVEIGASCAAEREAIGR
jgi:hypothetical protein